MNARTRSYRPRPGDDETLGSHLTRAAHGLGVAPVRCVSMVWGSRRPLLYQDLDDHALPHMVDRIAVGTRLDGSRIIAMTFAGLEGRLMPRRWPAAHKVWILPVSVSSHEAELRALLRHTLRRTRLQPHLRRVGASACPSAPRPSGGP